ncbi:MAG: haloacid dehalogenase-like hydrolase [Ruminiclostridium sp.]|nr:haloacid dehalogenase-like hydrolase [Ruminiclostridium sp.]
MKKTKRMLAALLAACMLQTSVLGAVTAGAETVVSSEAQSAKPVVTASFDGKDIKLTWTSVAGAVKYRLYEYENGKLKKLADKTGCSATIKNAAVGRDYKFAVRARVDGKWTSVTKGDLVTVSASSSSAAEGEKMLSLWTSDAKAKTELISYMKAITTEGSKDYIPVENRIAVFDFDGTLFCETDPNYFDYTLLKYRVLEDPDYKDKASDFEKEVANKIKEQNETGKSFDGLEVDHGKAVASAFKGMTLDEFNSYIQKFKKQSMPSYDGMKRGEGFYRPMLQVIDYLKANGFTVYVVSGTDRFIVRGIVYNSALDLPNSQIIGSDELLVATNQGDTDGLKYTFTDADKLVLGGKFIIKNLKTNKVTVIAQEIGEQPVLSFGNSTGDASMAEYATSGNKYRSLAFMLCCDDTERENGNIEKADKMYSLCDEFDWVPISMKNDWTTIYGDGITYNGAKTEVKPAA